MNIYISIPDNIKVSDINKNAVLGYLRTNPDHFFSAREISLACGIKPDHTQISVRKAITELLEVDHYPIISSSIGYCYTTDSDKLDAYLNELALRLIGIDRRMEAIRLIQRRL